VQPQYIGEVGKLMFKCQISWGYCVPKIIKIGWFLTELLKSNMWTFFETQSSRPSVAYSSRFSIEPQYLSSVK